MLLERQLSLETDTGVEKIGDGTSRYTDITPIAFGPSGSGGGENDLTNYRGVKIQWGVSGNFTNPLAQLKT